MREFRRRKCCARIEAPWLQTEITIPHSPAVNVVPCISARLAPLAARRAYYTGSLLRGALLVALATGCVTVQQPMNRMSAYRMAARDVGYASDPKPSQPTDDFINTMLKQMRYASPAFDSALKEIERSGVPVRIGTDEELTSYIPRAYQSSDRPWQALTAVYPLTRNGARGHHIDYVVVILRADLVNALQTAAASRAIDDSTLLARHLQRVLAHEIYGHLMPQLQLGLTAPIACDDPLSAADWYTACVMERERHVVAELTLARSANALLAQRQQQQ